MSEEKKDFVVKDRRIFSEDSLGTDEKEANKKPASKETEAPAPEGEGKKEFQTDKADEAAPGDTAAEKEQEAEPQMPEINFSTFVFSLNASALVNLGEIENPATGKKEKSLSLAKQTIDILGMLAEKTSKNLTTDEEKLLKGILYDLRINYVRQKG